MTIPIISTAPPGPPPFPYFTTAQDDSDESSSPTQSEASPPANSQECPKPASTLSDLKAILGNLRITPKRLTIAENPFVRSHQSDIFVAKLDEDSEFSRAVAVKHFLLPVFITEKDARRRRQIVPEVAEALKLWAGLKHPNVLELVGCSLNRNGHLYRLMSPYMIRGDIRRYLAKEQVGVAQRLGFVRDVTAGLDFLHSQNPPICCGDLNPLKILIDDTLSAVLGGFGIYGFYTDRSTSTEATKFVSPEALLGDGPKRSMPGDVWSWGCSVFEILTNTPPFGGDRHFAFAMITRSAPGRAEMLLDLVPGDPKAGYASALRLLHFHISLCWEYDPRRRPLVSSLLTQAFTSPSNGKAGYPIGATLEDLARLLIAQERLRIFDGSKLGSGNYGEVVRGILDDNSPNRKEVAVKRLKAVGARGEHVRLAKRLARELNVLATIQHPNVVKLIGYYLDERYESPLLISALMHYGNVLEYIEIHKPELDQKIAFVKGITAGLACLHNHNPPVCHADLKPANVLVDENRNAVLCDFGLASFVSGSPTLPNLVTSTTLKGTSRFMSSELFFGGKNCKHSLESDVWAWACTVFQLITGRFPYPEAPASPQICVAIIEKRLPGDVDLLLSNSPKQVHSEAALALRFLHSKLPDCWNFEPRRRPSIRDLLSQISNLSPGAVLSPSSHEDVDPNGSGEGMILLEALQTQSDERVNHDEAAQGDGKPGLEIAFSQGEKTIGTRATVDRVETGIQEGPHDDGPNSDEGTQGRNRNIRIDDHTQGDSVVEDNVEGEKDETKMKKDASNGEQRNKDQTAAEDHDRLTGIAYPPSNISTLAIGQFALGLTIILALSAIAYPLLRKSESSALPDLSALRLGHSHTTISAQSLSKWIWHIACIISLCANMYLIFQNVRPKFLQDRSNPQAQTT